MTHSLRPGSGTERAGWRSPGWPGRCAAPASGCAGSTACGPSGRQLPDCADTRQWAQLKLDFIISPPNTGQGSNSAFSQALRQEMLSTYAFDSDFFPPRAPKRLPQAAVLSASYISYQSVCFLWRSSETLRRELAPPTSSTPAEDKDTNRYHLNRGCN